MASDADTPRWIGAVALVAMAACVIPSVSHRTGPALDPEEVAGVRPGRTTKRELFAALGPPFAIAARGEVVAVESPVAMVGDGGMCQQRMGGAYRVDADAWFEPFAARRALRDDHRVYYWYSWRASGWNWYLLLALVASCGNSVREVWALVDESTGTVDDLAVR